MRRNEDHWFANTLGSRTSGLRVAFAGSRDLRVSGALSTLLNIIANLPDGSEIRLRRGRATEPGILERAVEMVARFGQITVTWVVPEGSGREATFHRDYRLVEGADVVYAFFSPEQIMSGGTGHIVDAALNRDIPVYAWEVTAEELRRIGEDDLHDLYNPNRWTE